MPNGSPSSGIGTLLREARIANDLSIKEVSWRLRIRPEFLRALENEQLTGLGHHAFLRTHVRSYAALLGLDPANVVEAFDARYAPAEPSPLETLNRQEREGRRQRPKLNWLRAGIAAAVALTVAASVGVLRGPGSGSEAARVPENPRLDAPRQASRDARLDKPVVAAAEVAGLVNIEVTAVAPAWVRVVGDGQLLFEGALAKGESRAFTAAGRIDARTPSAEALRWTLGGAPFSPGVRGEWSGSFTPSGLASRSQG